jgi:hypothetical protein
MKRLMLDHYRRWWRVLALGAALEFGLGFTIAADPKLPFEFWAFLLALWTGATLLSFDLKNGALRALAPLPLTSRQIGRGWWLATVPIPAMVLAALLFSGAAAYCHIDPSRAFPTERLALASFFTLVWLGISFTLIFNATRVFFGSPWAFIGNSFISILTVAAFFSSMAFATNASKSPLKSTILLGLGSSWAGPGFTWAGPGKLTWAAPSALAPTSPHCKPKSSPAIILHPAVTAECLFCSAAHLSALF